MPAVARPRATTRARPAKPKPDRQDRAASDQDEAPSVLAARLAAEGDTETGERPSLSAAAKRHGVTRQAAHAAFRRLYALPALPVGRPRSANPRSHVQTIRLADGKRADVRLTEAEVAAWRAAAGDAGVSAWIQVLLERNPAPRRAVLSAHLREIGNRAALKSEQ